MMPRYTDVDFTQNIKAQLLGARLAESGNTVLQFRDETLLNLELTVEGDQTAKFPTDKEYVIDVADVIVESSCLENPLSRFDPFASPLNPGKPYKEIRRVQLDGKQLYHFPTFFIKR